MEGLVEPIKRRNHLKMLEKFLLRHNRRNYVIFTLGINSGLRVSDILKLNIGDVKNKTHLEIREKKTNKYKRFPLNRKLQLLIKSYLENERASEYFIGDEEPLFLGKKHCRLCRSQVYRFLNQACRELNININIGTHSMRKSFGYHFYKQYKDVALLQKILNHSSPSVTLRYIGITQDEIDYSYSNFEI